MLATMGPKQKLENMVTKESLVVAEFLFYVLLTAVKKCYFFLYLSFRCDGQTSCHVVADNTFGDPCVGVPKYTEIKYQCV